MFFIEEPEEADIPWSAEQGKSRGLDPKEWQDAFLWFEMAIGCAACGLETPGFVSYECG